MDIELAIKLVDKLVFQKNNQHLSSIQINLLRGIWLNQSYEEIAKICYCSVSNIKFLGSEFWTELSQILKEKVTKRTVRAILESYHQDLKTGKLKITNFDTDNKNTNLSETINNTNTLNSEKISDFWFDSDILLRLTQRLDDSLDTIANRYNANLDAIKSLSEQMRLIHQLSNTQYCLNRSYLDVIKFCRNLINDFKIDFPQRKIILSLFEEPILPDYDLSVIILMDERLLKNILQNLLTNALQYSHSENTVTLDINVEEHKGIFTVVDEGIGIPANELNQVFQPFYCATNARQSSGHGLGLTIVEKCVRLHQGEVFISSQLQHGSTFTVVLPII